jgi:hypothetical protein
LENEHIYTVMEKITRVRTKQRIDMKNFESFSKSTGERVDFTNEYIYRDVDMKQVIYDCDHFVYVNTERISSLIKNGMDLSEIGLLMVISIRLKPVLNVCMQYDDKPHTTNSISKIIGYSQDRTKKKLDKLLESGVIGHQKIQGHENLGKVYYINPHYVRFGYKYSDIIPPLFYDTIEDHKRYKSVKKILEKPPITQVKQNNLSTEK